MHEWKAQQPLPELLSSSQLAAEPLPHLQHDATYERETLAFRRALEIQPNMRRGPDYCSMHMPVALTPVKRQFAVHWMTNMAHRALLLPDTLHLAVALMDRYLSLVDIGDDMLKYVSLTSLVLATKYHSIGRTFSIQDFSDKTGERCSMEQIITMERTILEKLNYTVSTPTALTFFRTFAKVITESPTDSKKLISLGHYLAGLSLLDLQMLNYLPSLIAASVVFLVRFTMDLVPWNSALQQCSGYVASELRSCVCRLHNLQRGIGFEEFRRAFGGIDPSVITIYSSVENDNVASLPTGGSIPESLFQN